MKTEARKPREVATIVENNGPSHDPHPWEISTKPGHHGRGKASNRLSRKALGYQVLHCPGPKKTAEFFIFLKGF
jgi:hypothetical protein